MAPRVSGTRTQDGPSAGARPLNPVAGQEKPAETQVSRAHNLREPLPQFRPGLALLRLFKGLVPNRCGRF